jgi:toxin ParE1/3/4
VVHEVVFAPEARDDILQLYDYITRRSNSERAIRFIERIVDYCESFSTFPERGARRDYLRPGLRTIGYRRRVTIAFHVAEKRVVIDRILYAGRDLATALP